MAQMTKDQLKLDLQRVKSMVAAGRFEEAKNLVRIQKNLPAEKKTEWFLAIAEKERNFAKSTPVIVLKNNSKKPRMFLAIVMLIIVFSILFYQLFVPKSNINSTIAAQNAAERIYQNAIIDCRERYSNRQSIRDCVFETLTSQNVSRIDDFMSDFDRNH